MRFKKLYLGEAFSLEKSAKALALIKKVLEKHIGKLYDYGSRDFDGTDGATTGVIYKSSLSPKAIRFNFKTGGSSTEIISVDIFDASDSKIPALNIPTKNLSIVKIIPIVIDTFNNPAGKGSIFVSDLVEGSLVEQTLLSEVVEFEKKKYATKADAAIGAFKAGKDSKFLRKNFGVSMATIQKKLEKLGDKKALKEVKLKKGSKGRPKSSKSDKFDISQLADHEFADPKFIFDELTSLVRMIVSGIQPSLLITGMAGIGKSFTVEDVLLKSGATKGKDFVITKGAVSPFGLYRKIFMNRKKIIVFDDSDDVFKDSTAVNILKAALDSNKVREVSWESKNTYTINPEEPLSDDEMDALAMGGEDGKPMYPNIFEFTGQIIFISNINQSKMDSAVKSRSVTIDITLKRKDVFKRMESILPKLSPTVTIFGKEIKVPHKLKVEVLEFLKNGKDFDPSKEANMRTFLNGVKIAMSGDANWRTMIVKYA